MKFLFLSQSYYPDQCGVSNVVGYLSEGLVERGHEVTVFTEKRKRSFLEHNKVSVIEFDCKGNAAIGYQGEIENYQKAVISFKCDVIILECAQVWNTDLVLPLLPQLNALRILHSHDFSYLKRKPRNPLLNYRWWRYFKELRKHIINFDGIFVLDETLPDARWLRDAQFGHVHVLPNGVHPDFFAPDLANQSQVMGKYELVTNQYAICVANYGEMKNQKGLLKEYIKSGLTHDLVLIGSHYNDYSNELKQIARKHVARRHGGESPQILVLAELNCSEHLALLFGAKVFIYASKLEAFPLVICEAIVAGIPWVSTNVGCVSSLPGGLAVDKETNLMDMCREIFNRKELWRNLKEDCQSSRNQFDYKLLVEKLLNSVSTINGSKG